MKLIIGDLEFSIGGIRVTSQQRFSATYQLWGIDDVLVQWAENALLSKSEFNLEIVNGSDVVLIGEHCLFNRPDRLNRSTDLIVNWVEKSLI
ncbi:hypothetical protein GCM10007906_26020 [Vibrio hyugaensis]|uniref:Uncharacterized protein n=1 Tax=Vibrio hyugaensis TaxID=1534743 RepID=A0ABQ5Y4P2_9VIBR|nr:hypothetical protein [Vibrio hyugaensis]GLR05014.1 hypothetical protein GCM10007906_26020 [Vibrio hyugaensis]